MVLNGFNIMQQHFPPSVKLLLYRQARSQGAFGGSVPQLYCAQKICFKHTVKQDWKSVFIKLLHRPDDFIAFTLNSPPHILQQNYAHV